MGLIYLIYAFATSYDAMQLSKCRVRYNGGLRFENKGTEPNFHKSNTLRISTKMPFYYNVNANVSPKNIAKTFIILVMQTFYWVTKVTRAVPLVKWSVRIEKGSFNKYITWIYQGGRSLCYGYCVNDWRCFFCFVFLLCYLSLLIIFNGHKIQNYGVLWSNCFV